MSVPDSTPQRGETWWADFSPTRGHEQRGRRPSLIVSDDQFNDSAASFVLLYPLAMTERPDIPWHIALAHRSRGRRRTPRALLHHVRTSPECVEAAALGPDWHRTGICDTEGRRPLAGADGIVDEVPPSL